MNMSNRVFFSDVITQRKQQEMIIDLNFNNIHFHNNKYTCADN